MIITIIIILTDIIRILVFSLYQPYTCHFIDPHTNSLRDTMLQRGKICFPNLDTQPRSEFQIYMATGHLHLAPPMPPGQRLNASSSSLICPGYPVSVKDTLLFPPRCRNPGTILDVLSLLSFFSVSSLSPGASRPYLSKTFTFASLSNNSAFQYC